MRILDKMAHFEQAGMLSLTVDRNGRTTPDTAANVNGFGSAVEAHRLVTEKRYVAELMRRLGVKVWVSVLEFQTKTGEGWPHWHVLLDPSSCPGGELSVRKVWQTWRDLWGIGGCDWSPPSDYADSRHAVNYVTKYLTKHPRGGYPQWVLNSKRRIRFVSCCRVLKSLVGEEGKERGKDNDDPQPVTPLIDRMSRCEESSRVWQEVTDRATGEVSVRLVGFIPLSADRVVRDARSAGLSAVVHQGEKGRTSRMISGTGFDGLKGLVAPDGGCWRSDFRRRVLDKRAALIASNRFARRCGWAGGDEPERRALTPETHLVA
jgi:hypothetical protein